MEENLGRDKMDAMGDGSDKRGGFRNKGGKVYFKKKIDKIKAHNLVIDYKHPEVLKRFVNDQGKILPRRITGVTALQQRRLAMAIKYARHLAIVPFVAQDTR